MAQRLGDTLPYRGVEFGVFDKGRGQWRWNLLSEDGARTREKRHHRRNARNGHCGVQGRDRQMARAEKLGFLPAAGYGVYS